MRDATVWRVEAAKLDVLAEAATTGGALKNKMKVNGEKMQALYRVKENKSNKCHETKSHFSDSLSQ